MFGFFSGKNNLYPFLLGFCLLFVACLAEPSPVLDWPNDLGEQIRVERQRRAWSQEELAEGLGISVESLRLIEAGRATPIYEKVDEIEAFLGIKIDKSQLDSLATF
ncbi:helix-turn-helix domain-containing protein [Saprospira sp. CCB-QB6]|uniref:helix-turn-helix domain-containing protein n=1 Tax=Saprospira sp. CCB-QB6 TaxID=3023936 RepID=UPI00234A1803|nr:helix-turn-helix domain-containing protein [Saprospira sp. CCB-QB6]WCL80157.1 helix-turn-helix domain-containing protein [Saprospira sp. CCB-QB6]